MSCACENICDSYTVIVCVRQCCNGDVLASRSVCIATIYIYIHMVSYITPIIHTVYGAKFYISILTQYCSYVYIYACICIAMHAHSIAI